MNHRMVIYWTESTCGSLVCSQNYVSANDAETKFKEAKTNRVVEGISHLRVVVPRAYLLGCTCTVHLAFRSVVHALISPLHQTSKEPNSSWTPSKTLRARQIDFVLQLVHFSIIGCERSWYHYDNFSSLFLCEIVQFL